MKVFHSPADKGSLFVKDTMDRAVRIEPGIKVGDALQRLKQHNASFGVLSNPEDKPFKIVRMDQLITVNVGELAQVLPASESLPKTVEPYDILQNVIQNWAEQFKIKQDLAGIVVQEQGNILGVLSSKRIRLFSNLLESSTPGKGGTQKGDALITDIIVGAKLEFECFDCPKGELCPEGPDKQERSVRDYISKGPPKCSYHQHIMYD